VRELAAQFGVGTATMHAWLSRLSDEGMVEWTAGRHRSLRLSQQGSQQLLSPAAP
jgi:transposase